MATLHRGISCPCFPPRMRQPPGVRILPSVIFLFVVYIIISSSSLKGSSVLSLLSQFAPTCTHTFHGLWNFSSSHHTSPLSPPCFFLTQRQ